MKLGTAGTHFQGRALAKHVQGSIQYSIQYWKEKK